MESESPKDLGSFHRGLLKERMQDSEFREEFERLPREMLEQLAPAIEGRVVNPGRKRSGRLIFGDAID